MKIFSPFHQIAFSLLMPRFLFVFCLATLSLPIIALATPSKTKPAPKIQLSKDHTLNSLLEEGHHQLALCELAKAEKTFLEILSKSPQHPHAFLGLAEIHEYRGERPIARQRRQQALKVSSNLPEAIATASLYDWTPVEADLRLRAALQLYPLHHGLNFAMGTLRLRQARHEEALTYLRFAVSQYPKHPDYLYQLAITEDLLRLPEARGHYEAALFEAEKTPHAFDLKAVTNRLTHFQGQ